MLPQSQNEFIKRFARWRRNLDACKALIRAPLADLDLGDLEIRAARQDLVQHFGQNKRVDDMTAQLDRFRNHPQNLPEESGHASGSRDVRRGVFIKRVSNLLFRSLATWKNQMHADLHQAVKRILL